MSIVRIISAWLKIPSRKETVMFAVLLAACAGLALIKPVVEVPHEGSKEKAVVLAVDDSNLRSYGNLHQGTQLLQVRILSGGYRDRLFPAVNELRANMELDKVFAAGDVILVGILDGAIPGETVVNAQDYYRIDNTLLLFGLFAVLLMIFGGFVGINALLSFVFSCLAVWKVVVPLALLGWEPVSLIFGAVVVLSVVIILLVAGLNRKGLSALAGTLLGVGVSAVMAWIFAAVFRINGAVMPYSQTLLFSGYEFISLPSIFVGGVFLSASGAVMDLAMDVASGIDEIKLRRPELGAKELFLSGIRIGRSVVGTMTTTLLLAYSGGYLTLMMVFAAQGISPVDFINNPHVASEVVKTLVGSFGLVLVAPFTALAGAIFYGKKQEK